MAERKERAYYGVIIKPTPTNSMGCRWKAEVGWSVFQADTLAGMKRLVRAHLGK